MANGTVVGTERGGAAGGIRITREQVQAKIDLLSKRLREDVKFRERPKEELLRITDTFLTSIPGFIDKKPGPRRQLSTHVLQQALLPTTGERVQQTLEDIEPVAPTVGLVAPGGNIPVGMAAGFTAPFITETARPFTTGESPDYIDAVRRGALNATLIGAGEKFIARPLSSALQKTVGKARRKTILGPEATSETTLKARETLEPFLTSPEGRPIASLTPAQLAGADKLPGLVNFAENIAESGLGGRAGMVAQRQTIDDAAQNVAQITMEALEQGFRTAEDVTNLFLSGIKGRAMVVRAISSRKHQIVDEISKQGIKVDTRKAVLQTALGPTTREVLRVFKVPEVRNNAGRVIKRGYSGWDGFFEIMNSGGPRRMSFADADRARSELLRIARDFGGFGASGRDKQVAQLAGSMAQSLKTAMDTSSRQLGPQAFQAYQAAKEFHKKQVIEVFEDELLVATVKALEKQPGKLGSFLMQRDNIDKLDVIKRALGEDAKQANALSIWPAVQGRILSTMINNSVKEEGLGLGKTFGELIKRGLVREISGAKLRDQIQNVGTESRRALLDGVPGEAFRRFTNAIDVASRRPEGPGKIGTVLVQFGAIATVAGALIRAVGGDWAAVGEGAFGVGVVMMLTPKALSRVLRNPERMRNLADGLIGGPKSKAFGRLLLVVTETNREVQQEVGASLSEVVTDPARGLKTPTQFGGTIPIERGGGVPQISQRQP